MEKRGWFLCVLGGEYLVRYVVNGESYLCCPLLIGDRLSSNGLEQYLGRAMELLACGPISQYEKLISVASAIDPDGEANEFYVSDDIPKPEAEDPNAEIVRQVKDLSKGMDNLAGTLRIIQRELNKFSEWQGVVNAKLERYAAIQATRVIDDE